jgi:hypothetical protein
VEVPELEGGVLDVKSVKEMVAFLEEDEHAILYHR